MMDVHVDDAVRGHDEEVADLRQMDARVPDRIDDEAPHEAEGGDLQVRILVQHLCRHADRDPGADAADQVVLAVLVAGQDDVDVVALVHDTDQLRDLFGRVLEIVVHGDDEVSIDVLKAAKERRVLPEVFGHLEDLDAMVFLS